MILESLVTTVDQWGEPNISPMGALVDEAITELVLRPYRTSETYEGLKRTRQGVLHVTDDVELIAQAAVNRIDPFPKVVKAKQVTGFVLADACRWFEFQVTSIEDRSDRATVACRVVERGQHRDFFGFNRAKHAVLEAAILATRLHLLPPDEIHAEFRRLAVPVDKTAGAKERRAFQFLEGYVTEKLKLNAC